ncbi:MAG: LptF/LptG family permease [Candidatus Didemnitutus sp.]|nr:LptF/LptG family permease [Candidatus Didemnitutus sp.]
MKLLHRHIFANVALTSLAAVGLFAFVLMIGNALRDLLGYLLAGQLELETFLQLIGLLIPFVVSYALPMGILTGVLLVLGRMSSDREIIAIRAAGVSVAGISAPILFFALLGTAASLAVNFQFMPSARLAYQRELAQAVRQNPLSFIVPKTFIRDFPGIVLYVGEKRGDATLQNFWLWEVDPQGRVKRFARADTGRLDYDEENNKLVLTLENAQAEQRDEKDPENFSVVRAAAAWDRATFDLPLDRVTGARTVRTKLKWQTYDQLLAEWRRLGDPDPAVSQVERERKRMKVQITIQEKCAMAFSVLSFALIAIPLGIKVSRKETSANLGIALALAMSYYFATIVVGWFDNKPELRPDLLMWLPNLAFQTLGIWMFRKVDRS